MKEEIVKNFDLSRELLTIAQNPNQSLKVKELKIEVPILIQKKVWHFSWAVVCSNRRSETCDLKGYFLHIFTVNLK